MESTSNHSHVYIAATGLNDTAASIMSTRSAGGLAAWKIALIVLGTILATILIAFLAGVIYYYRRVKPKAVKANDN